jgi:hypothetical protein
LFCKTEKNVRIKSSWSEQVTPRRSTVWSFPFSKDSLPYSIVGWRVRRRFKAESKAFLEIVLIKRFLSLHFLEEIVFGRLEVEVML